MRFLSRPIYVLTFFWLFVTQISLGMPKIPQSERILTFQEVKNFWMNEIIHASFPREPSGLYPREQAEWRNALRARNEKLRDIRCGLFDEEARIAQLRHNSHAWRLKGHEQQANLLDAELRKITLYRAQLESLQFQRQALQNQVDLIVKIDELKRQIEAWSRCCP